MTFSVQQIWKKYNLLSRKCWSFGPAVCLNCHNQMFFFICGLSQKPMCSNQLGHTLCSSNGSQSDLSGRWLMLLDVIGNCFPLEISHSSRGKNNWDLNPVSPQHASSVVCWIYARYHLWFRPACSTAEGHSALKYKCSPEPQGGNKWCVLHKQYAKLNRSEALRKINQHHGTGFAICWA